MRGGQTLFNIKAKGQGHIIKYWPGQDREHVLHQTRYVCIAYYKRIDPIED